MGILVVIANGPKTVACGSTPVRKLCFIGYFESGGEGGFRSKEEFAREVLDRYFAHTTELVKEALDAIHNQELVFQEKRLRDQGTDAARSKEPSQDGHEMDK